MLGLKLLPLLLGLLPWSMVCSLPAKCEKREFAETQTKYQQCAAAKIDSISKALEDGAGLNTLCGAVRELIHSCGDELGWCFTEDQVEETKTKQRMGLESVLSQHLAAPSLEACLADHSTGITNAATTVNDPTTSATLLASSSSKDYKSTELAHPLSTPTRVPRLLPPPKSSSTSSSTSSLPPLLLLFLLLLLQT